MQLTSGHPIGILRREFLQVGFSGLLGVSMPGLLAIRARAGTIPGASKTPPLPKARARSVIVVFLTGGLSHIDSFDMKPEAPEGIRGEFQPIGTSVPGIHYCEHLPRLAERADKLAVVRTLCHGYTNHLNATHEILTGHPQPGAFFDKIASRDDYPCYAAAVDAIRPRSDGIPSGVMLPTFLMEGPLVWPGQHAGFLGPRHDPWQVKQDPNRSGFGFDGLNLPTGLSVERLDDRKSLLDRLSAGRDALASRAHGAKDPFADTRSTALMPCCSPARWRAPSISAGRTRGFATITDGTCTGSRS